MAGHARLNRLESVEEQGEYRIDDKQDIEKDEGAK